MASLASVKLTQEIMEEFLTCKLCYQQFVSPKCLTCLHTFCQMCLDKQVATMRRPVYGSYVDLPCPICRKHTTLPTGGVRNLPDNFMVTNLKEAVGKRSAGKLPFCEFCRALSKKIVDAVAKCLDCNKQMCVACTQAHREMRLTKAHTVCDTDTEKDIECKAHSDEQVRFYCQPCDQLVCILCTFEDHAGHDINDMKEGADKMKEGITNLLVSCKQKADELKQQLDAMHDCSTHMHDTEQRIHASARDVIAAVRGRERELVHELHAAYGDDTIEFLESRADVKSRHDGLVKNLRLAESLREKEVEFLFVKKELEEKLGQLAGVKVRSMPDNVTKQFDFLQGPVELGSISEPAADDDVDDDDDDDDDDANSDEQPTMVETCDKCVGTAATLTLTQAAQTQLSQRDVKFVPLDDASAATQTPTLPTCDASTQLPNEKQQKVHVTEQQGIAILPNGDLVIIDTEENRLAIMDKRGRFRYTFDNEQLTLPDKLQLGKLRDFQKDTDQHIRIYTPYGHLLSCYEDEVITCLPLGTRFEKKEMFRQ
ncbi:PREDICTED: E3 ubiquitin-protein ligase TRIM56-like [Priapulus caudatus]|uniref:E3 ubiquitin-protein ligase TRIM56-like n=1 Tax=Priapulus caudatus TaxID=37621 RepID=A0ABM1EPI6_PRICU|nr:PREDICTED: E3 ubiquitin-protein ligase TRIM56-like [Priapulus caudatus]